MTSDYLDANRKLWDEWTDVHVASRFYDVEGFKNGDLSLYPFEIEEAGDVRGTRLLHLQCHFGLDTMSFARLGAHVTGLDFSPRAIEVARSLAQELRIDATFVQGDAMHAADVLAGPFDFIYTGGGAIGWLSNLEPWARGIAKLLAPGGRFYLREFHPIAWLFDDSDGATEPNRVAYPYFRSDEPIVSPVQGSYADPGADVTQAVHYSWAHSFDEILGSLLDQGLRLRTFKEHRHIREKLFPWLEQHDDGNWYAIGCDIPLMFSLTATKD